MYYNVPDLIRLHGGKDLFIAKLQDFYNRSPDFTTWSPNHRIPNPNAPQYWDGTFNNPGNEPTELIVFLFNRAGAPWLTDKYLLNEENVYKVGPDGLPGDDDVGQLSAWYVTAASAT